MAVSASPLEIPKSLLGKQKTFSEEIAGEEINAQNSVYNRATRLAEALSELGDGWVELPDSNQEITLGEAQIWPATRSHLHLFGNTKGSNDGLRSAEKLHLVTFAPVRFVGGTRISTEGVSVEFDISENCLVALPSQSKEFQFVEGALDRISDVIAAQA